MKFLRIFNNLMLCVYCVGLISCKSESSEPSAPPPSPKKTVEEPQQLKVADEYGMTTLKGQVISGELVSQTNTSLTHLIQLSQGGKPVNEDRKISVSITARCQWPDSKNLNTLSQKTSTYLRPEFPLFELVPQELWLEQPGKSKTLWSCDFHFEAKNSFGDLHIFDIGNVPVGNTSNGLRASYKKLGLLVDTSGHRILTIKQSQFNDFWILSDSLEADSMKLICSDMEVPLVVPNTNFQSLSGIDLNSISDLNFLKEKPFHICRIAIYKEKRLVGISPLTQIRFEMKAPFGTLSVKRKMKTKYQKHSPQTLFMKTPLWSFSFKNSTSFTRYYQIELSNPKTFVSFLARARDVRSSWFKTPWKMKITSPKKSILSSKEGNWLVKLKPGQIFSGEVSTSFEFKCKFDFRGSNSLEESGYMQKTSARLIVSHVQRDSLGTHTIQTERIGFSRQRAWNEILPPTDRDTTLMKKMEELPNLGGCEVH